MIEIVVGAATVRIPLVVCGFSCTDCSACNLAGVQRSSMRTVFIYAIAVR
jgi:hypothetical protein